MSTNFIYSLTDGVIDQSRWLEIGQRGGASVTLNLIDLCQPGCVSSLKDVFCPTDSLQGVLKRGGTLQITATQGYLVIRVDPKNVNLEFRGHQDGSATKCVLERQAIAQRLDELQVSSDVATFAVSS